MKSKHYFFLYIGIFYTSFSLYGAGLQTAHRQQERMKTPAIPLEDLFLYGDQCARELSYQGKPVIAVLGPTKSGKSTLICDALGAEWILKEEKKEVKKNFIDEDGLPQTRIKKKTIRFLCLKNPEKYKKGQLPSAGHEKLQSHTLIPKGYTLKDAECCYCDTAGLFDSDPGDTRTFSQFFPMLLGNRLPEKCLKAIFLVCAAGDLSTASAGEHMKNLFTKIGSYFAELKRQDEAFGHLRNCLFLFVNKCRDEDEYEEIKEGMEELAIKLPKTVKRLEKKLQKMGISLQNKAKSEEEKEEPNKKEKATKAKKASELLQSYWDTLYQFLFFRLMGKYSQDLTDYALDEDRVIRYDPLGKKMVKNQIKALLQRGHYIPPSVWGIPPPQSKFMKILDKLPHKMNELLSNYNSAQEDLLTKKELIQLHVKAINPKKQKEQIAKYLKNKKATYSKKKKTLLDAIKALKSDTRINPQPIYSQTKTFGHLAQTGLAYTTGFLQTILSTPAFIAGATIGSLAGLVTLNEDFGADVCFRVSSLGYVVTSPLQLIPGLASLFHDGDRWGLGRFTYQGREYVSAIKITTNNKVKIIEVSPGEPFVITEKDNRSWGKRVVQEVIGSAKINCNFDLFPDEPFYLKSKKSSCATHRLLLMSNDGKTKAKVKMYVKNNLFSGTRAEITMKKKEIKKLKQAEKELVENVHKLVILQKTLTQTKKNREKALQTLLKSGFEAAYTYDQRLDPLQALPRNTDEERAIRAVVPIVLAYLNHAYFMKSYNTIMYTLTHQVVQGGCSFFEYNFSKYLMLKYWKEKAYAPGAQQKDSAERTLQNWNATFAFEKEEVPNNQQEKPIL